MGYTQKSAEEKKKEIDAAMEKIENALPEVFTSKNFRDYLKFQSKFHHYSVNNIILIKLQNPNASLVAGYKQWQDKFERQVVQKGAIKIFAPMKYKKLVDKPVLDEFGDKVFDENGNLKTEKKEVQYVKYRLVNVFDVSQTEGKPLPSLTKELEGTDIRARALISAIQKVSEFHIAFAGNENEMIKQGAKGYYSKTFNHIVIKENMSDLQTAKTLAHEYTHGSLHSNSDKPRDIKEIEAEATAFVISDYFGFDTGEYSFPYIAGWAMNQNAATLHEVLDSIQKSVQAIIDKIEPEFKKELELEHELEKEQDLELAFELAVEIPEQFDSKEKAMEYVQERKEVMYSLGRER